MEKPEGFLRDTAAIATQRSGCDCERRTPGNLGATALCAFATRSRAVRRFLGTSLSRDKEVRKNRPPSPAPSPSFAFSECHLPQRGRHALCGKQPAQQKPQILRRALPSTHSAPRAADRRAFGFVGSSAQLRGQPAGCQNDTLRRLRQSASCVILRSEATKDL